MMYSVVFGSVKYPLQRSQCVYSFSVDPELVQQVELLMC